MDSVSKQRVALVDVNNMYVSCERIFRPDLEYQPLVVLSNNDGCIVSRSAEVKAMDIPMGVPWFKVKDKAEAHGVIAFSSNYALYADISHRIMSMLSHYTSFQEVYSIDESFLDFTGIQGDLTEYAHTIRDRVRQWVGVPTCIGIGSSKTLAKLANTIAKKEKNGRGVCDLTILTQKELESVLATLSVAEVWGVGHRLAIALKQQGITTARDLYLSEPSRVKKQFNILVERMVLELRGIACLEIEDGWTDKKQIISSRSFGKAVYSLEELNEAITLYISQAAQKLRQQHSVAKGLQVFIRSNRFKTGEALYSETITLSLPDYSSDTLTLIHYALRGLKHIYKPGIAYAKAGVCLSELIPASYTSAGLFAEEQQTAQQRSDLMAALDAINHRYGKNTIGAGVSGLGTPRSWTMRRAHKTPAYTTSWAELPLAYAN